LNGLPAVEPLRLPRLLPKERNSQDVVHKAVDVEPDEDVAKRYGL
jgi:hypothetical protein